MRLRLCDGERAVDERLDLLRVAQLEENERRQAELINQMAEQIAQLSRAGATLYRRTVWLTAALGITIVLAVIGITR